MAPLTESITVARPPEDVYAYLDDLAHHPDWQTDLTENRVLTDGPTRVGTEVEATRKVGGRAAKIKWRITEHEPPNRTVFETYEGQLMKPRGVVTVEPDGGGSKVTFTMEPRFEGLGRLLGPLVIERQLRKSIPDDLRRLKERLEAG